MKGEERTGNTKRNILYGLLQVIVSQLLPFIVRTILIYRFGKDYLGLNSLFTSIMSVLSLMEMGFGTAVVYSMYKPVAEGDTGQICAYLSYFRRIYCIIGFAVLGVGLVLMPFLPHLIHDPTLPGEINLYSCYIIFLADIVISYLLFGYMTAIPIAYQRRDILSLVEMGSELLKCVLRLFVLLFSSSFYLFLVAMPIVTIIRNLIVAAIIRQRYPDVKCRGKISSEQKHDLNRKVHGLLVDKLTNVSRNSIDSLCISAFIGLAAVGMYNNYYFVLRAIGAFSGAICRSMMPSAGNSIAIESRDKNYNDLRLFDFIYMAIAGWATVCMLCLYQPFIELWGGKSMMLETSVVIGLCLYFYILKAGDIRWVYHEGAGLWYECRFIMIGEAVANILLNILLCKVMGVFGVVLATVLSVFATNCILCPKVLFDAYFKNGKLKEYWKDHILYTATMLLTATISYGLCEFLFQGTGIDIMVGRGLICSLASVAVIWILWHRSERYEKAVIWMRRMIKA